MGEIITNSDLQNFGLEAVGKWVIFCYFSTGRKYPAVVYGSYIGIGCMMDLKKIFSVVLSFWGSIPHLDIEEEWPPSPSGKNPRKPQRAAVAWGNPKKSES